MEINYYASGDHKKKKKLKKKEKLNKGEKSVGSGGIRTHASEETGALNQRLRPLGHATSWLYEWLN